METFSDRLGAAIAKSGKRKSALAAELGVRPSVISRWLSGVQPSYQALGHLAAALDVAPSDLLPSAQKFTHLDNFSGSSAAEDIFGAMFCKTLKLNPDVMVPATIKTIMEAKARGDLAQASELLGYLDRVLGEAGLPPEKQTPAPAKL